MAANSESNLFGVDIFKVLKFEFQERLYNYKILKQTKVLKKLKLFKQIRFKIDFHKRAFGATTFGFNLVGTPVLASFTQSLFLHFLLSLCAFFIIY